MSIARSYIKHRLRAKTRHGVHSPFVYDLIENVFKPRGAHKQASIEAHRRQFKSDRTPLTMRDLGAGPRKGGSPRRTVASIARHSATAPNRAAMLQRLIDRLDLGHVLELGTNLGLTTAYFAAAEHCVECVSLEADPGLAELARQLLMKLDLDAQVVTGSFEDRLSGVLRQLERVDFAYIDGNHRQIPTVNYFDSILPYTTETSVVVVGDIHWSPGMEDAWQKIKNHAQTRLTIDLFDLGLVFFDPHRAKQHFTLSY